MIKNITNLGDAAVYCDFGNQIDQETNLNVIKYFKNLKELKIEGITNITPSYNKLIVSFEPSVTNYEKLKNKIIDLKLHNKENQNSKLIKINKSEKGHYSLLRIDSSSSTINEIERIQKLNEDILRFITIKTEEISKEPSVMLKSSEKKDVY